VEVNRLNLWDLMTEELESRDLAYVRDYGWFYMASLGAHILNNRQRVSPVLFLQGLPFDIRLHILMVAPSGFGKSIWLYHFLDERFGLSWVQSFNVSFQQTMSSAGFVGTIKFSDGEVVKVPGVAKRYESGIIGVEEFSGITKMFLTSHGGQLDNQLLTALDKGMVVKSLGPGELKYKTGVTLWAGTQPSRFDLSSGMGRRFCFLVFLPTDKDIELFVEKRERGMNKVWNKERTKEIRKRIDELMREVYKIEKIIPSERLYEILRRYKTIHYEYDLYERLALGYTLLKYGVKKEMKVIVDNDLIDMIRKEYVWREQVKRGPEVSQIINVIRSEEKNEIDIVKLKSKLVLLGLDWKQSSELIRDAERLGLIKINGRKVRLGW